MAGQKRRASSRKSGSFALDQSPSHLLRRAQQFAVDIYAEEVGSDGLTPRQFAVLLTVSDNEGLSQTDLVRLTGIDRSTLADMISRLLKRDLLGRKRTEDDQRANAVRITGAGRRALKSAMPGVKRAELRVINAVPSSQRRSLIDALTVLANAADALANGAAEPERAPRGRKRRGR